MLQLETVPASLAGLLWVFRSCFTAPSFATFGALVVGLVAQSGRRTVCGMLVGAGLSRVWHHSRAHWFFSHARWSADVVGLALLALVVDWLLPAGAPIVVAVDDTLFRRSGRRVAGAGWQHDGAAKGPRANKISWGTCFVVAGILVELPFAARPVCLPVLAQLSRPKAALTDMECLGVKRAWEIGRRRQAGLVSGARGGWLGRWEVRFRSSLT